MPSILIIGAGAVGAFFGAALARQGAHVSVVCRSNFDAVKSTGFYIRSPLLGDHHFRPAQVFRSVDEVAPTFDYVALSTKVLEHTDRAALIRPAVATNTTIVLIQNGIEIERELAEAFPHNELLSAIAFIGVSRADGGEIHHQSAGWLTLGRYPTGLTPSAQRLATMFEASGVRCTLTGDVVAARWQKALWNATFNPISILGAVLDTETMLRTEQDRAFIREAMLEVAGVAAAAGHALDLTVVDKLIETTRKMPAYKTSMALDLEHGRPMEVEAILGNVVRTGREHAVSIPTLEAIYAIAKMVEHKARKARQ
jgi:2-dehydropantoate 2-reductase